MKSYIYLFLMSLMSLGSLYAQEASVDEEIFTLDKQEEDVRTIRSATLDKEEWENLTKDLDYDEKDLGKKPTKNIIKKQNQGELDPKNMKKASGKEELESSPDIKEKPKIPQKKPVKLNMKWLKYVFYVLGIALLLFLLYRLVMLKKLVKKNEKAINTLPAETLPDDIEDIHHLQETDFERYLRTALEGKDYRQAIRIYYLQILKELSQAGHIEWKRNKTNAQYIREMSQHAYKKEFREATLVFEKIWYGYDTPTETYFQTCQVIFEQLLYAIKP